MRRIVVTVTPWYYDQESVEVRLTVEIGSELFEDRQVIRIPEFESAFDHYLRRMGEAVKQEWRKQEQQNIAPAGPSA